MRTPVSSIAIDGLVDLFRCERRHLLSQNRAEEQDGVRCFSELFVGNLLERTAGEAGNNIGEAVRGVCRIDEVGIQHDVIADPIEGDAVRSEDAERALHVVHGLGDLCVVEQCAQFGCVAGVECDAQTLSWNSGDRKGQASGS
jgi:hypothetical protein